MKDMYLLKYSVKGIKSLDKLVSLSFYKKTITKDMDTQGFNIKGIYGMNGSGKSGIMASIQILKNILTDSNYLNNPISQKTLDSLVNKKLSELFIEVEYVVRTKEKLLLFRYNVALAKKESETYIIKSEELSFKNATTRKENMSVLYKVNDGALDLKYFDTRDKTNSMLAEKTINLLDKSSFCSIAVTKIIEKKIFDKKVQMVVPAFIILYNFGTRLHVYLDNEDTHIPFIIAHMTKYGDTTYEGNEMVDSLLYEASNMDAESMNMLAVGKNFVNRDSYYYFENEVHQLYEFLHIFKSDLVGIEIEKKEYGDKYVCELVMVYNEYRVNVEFESTGIKKLVKLYMYIREMKRGGIVFIDEFDANLHDVYLCALLEYLMEYGEGQLCFTTHNIGPMDILKRNSNSIDFISGDHRIYSWKKSGNYSPANLYRKGMIEGSPFNVDSIDFIDAFGIQEGDE